jgi:peptide/nickel transport system ATP-binding protein
MTADAAALQEWQNGKTRPEPILEVRRLTKHFPIGGAFSSRRVHALEDASFSLRPGEVISLVGESGSGKSTTARLIARLIAPTAGEIIFKGKNVLKTEPKGASLAYRSKVQMIFQDPFGSLNPAHTIGHHLGRPLSIHKKAASAGELREVVDGLLAAVGLNPPAEFALKYPHELSGGQRQRVAIARALAVDPEVILADELVSMLDVSIRMGVLNLMETLKKERRIAFLYITHDLASARYVADQIIVMYAGHMVEGAPSEKLMGEPAHPYTQLLLSAVPNPHAKERQAVEARGEVSSLVDLSPGCPFAPRCPKALEACRQVMPEVRNLSAGRWVRCHLYH